MLCTMHTIILVPLKCLWSSTVEEETAEAVDGATYWDKEACTESAVGGGRLIVWKGRVGSKGATGWLVLGDDLIQ